MKTDKMIPKSMNDSNHTNLELEIVIRNIKNEFRRLLSKRKQLIQELGNAFEKVVSDKESICEEIKNTLKEEITDGIISARLIESYSPTEWKHKTRPKTQKTKPENEKTSFSDTEKIPEEQPRMILLTNRGSSSTNKEPSTYAEIQTEPRMEEESDHNDNSQVQNSTPSTIRPSDDESLLQINHLSHFEFFVSRKKWWEHFISPVSRLSQDQDMIHVKVVVDKRTGIGTITIDSSEVESNGKSQYS